MMIERPIIEFLERSGIIAPGETPEFESLPGGVSSDIWVVRTRFRTFCVKRALPQLRVAAEWRADVARNAAEVEWLTQVAKLDPDLVPTVLASDRLLAVFAMEYLPPVDYESWKMRLARGVVNVETAAVVGHQLAAIHRAFAVSSDAPRQFDHDASFHALRVEPYLLATARVHSDVATILEELAARTERTKRTVVHGDVSPKNILLGRRGPVFLDAECAWFGDPAFDLSFCLNHLLLKTLWIPSSEADLLQAFDALVGNYLRAVDWESPADLERRAATLLPALLLARIDGKSPVEYLTDEWAKDTVRRTSKPLLLHPPADLGAVRRAWASRRIDGRRASSVLQDFRIENVIGRRVWDSRGRPTVEAEIVLNNGAIGRAIAPAGASTGIHEAVELRDGGRAFGGFGVDRAVQNVSTEIAAALRGCLIDDQEAIDRRLVDLDGTPNKRRLGANAIVSVSMAALHAAAAARREPLWRVIANGAEPSLPMPMIQIFGGGAHAGQRLDVQDFLVIPVGASTFTEAVSMAAQIYAAAGHLMAEQGRLHGVADEGGWWPEFSSNKDALDTLVAAIERSRLRPGVDVAIAIDVAASQLRQGVRYRLAADECTLSSEELIELLLGWCRDYPIVSIEDPLAEDDHEGMRLFTARAGGHVQIVGDDYLVTSSDRIAAAAASGACNAVLLKPNQIGTITETAAALVAARDAGWGTIVSARSGETEDVTIVHLAVGWAAGQLKVGSCTRSERTAKWNEALRIEEALGEAAVLDRLPVRAALWMNSPA